MYGSDNVEFMGILVDRQYTPGQKYAQLVFETAEGIRLSLTRNIGMVRSLRLGLTYKVEGPERAIGQKRYIHEPTATPVRADKSSLPFFRRYKVFVPVAISLVVVLGGASALVYAAQSTNANSQSTVHEKKPATKLSSETITPASVPANPQSTSDTASPSPAQQQTRTTSVPSTKKSTSAPPTAPTGIPAASNSITPVVIDEQPSIPGSQDDPNQSTEEQTLEEIKPPVDETDPDSLIPS